MTPDELAALLDDRDLPNADVRRRLDQAVFRLRDFESLMDGSDRGRVFGGDSRSLRLLNLGENAPLVRTKNGWRLLYVLAGHVAFAEYAEGDQPLTAGERWVVGEGQWLMIEPERVHRVRARGDSATMLEILLGESRPSVEDLDPGLAAGDDNAADYYYEYDECYRKVYEEGGELWEMPGPNAALVAFVEEREDRLGRRVIDCGCGEGRDSLWLAKRGFEVTGVDVSRAALERARERAAAEGVDVTFLERDVIHLRGVPEKTFDLALNMGCLHMLKDAEHRARHLRRVAEVIKPGAYFVLAHCRSEWLKGFYSVPDYEAVGPAVTGKVLPRRIRLPGGGEKWIELPTTHFKEAGEDELAAELEAAGLEVERALGDSNEAFGNTAVMISRKPKGRQ
jgi:ubiquinone/menaquinone biosynthesis C-methylase UbiE